jgi:hypothetical protein
VKSTPEDAVDCLNKLIAEETIEMIDLAMIIPVVFPEHLQDGSNLPQNSDFARIINGTFRWQNEFRRVCVIEDFPFEWWGEVYGDDDDSMPGLLTWLRDYGVVRKPELVPPLDLFGWYDRVIGSDEFAIQTKPMNMSRERERTEGIVRRRIWQAIRFMPGGSTVKGVAMVSKESWKTFSELSNSTKEFVDWDGVGYRFR